MRETSREALRDTIWAARKSSKRLRGPDSLSDDSSTELGILSAGRDELVESRREGALGFVCCCCCCCDWGGSCGALSVEVTDSLRRLLELRDCAAGDTRPDWANCCWAKAKSDGCCELLRRARSEFPRVSSVTGGPLEVSSPWPLECEAGGRRVPGERGSKARAALWGEKYEGEVADDAIVGSEGVVVVARLSREETEAAVELTDGRRNRVGGSGAVLVRWCLGGEGWDWE